MGGRRDRDWVSFHQISYMQFGQLMAIITSTFALQRFGIDRTPLNADGGVVTNDAGEHQRENDLVIKCELEDHQNCHDRRVSGGGEKGTHSHESKGAWIDQNRQLLLGQASKEKSAAGANK